MRLADIFEPYILDNAGQYTYRTKGKEAVQEHLQKIGQTIHTLLQELKAAYAQETVNQVMERLFSKNIHLVEGKVKHKENSESTSH